MNTMIPAEEVIRDSIRFDYDVTGNAIRILENLREEGYVIVPRAGSLPEIQRMYGETVGIEHASHMKKTFEKGQRKAA